MNKGDFHTNQKVLRLCRSIHKRANDLEKLQPLVVQLNEVLRQVNYKSSAVRVASQPQEDNPFDKIMADGFDVHCYGTARH